MGRGGGLRLGKGERPLPPESTVDRFTSPRDPAVRAPGAVRLRPQPAPPAGAGMSLRHAAARELAGAAARALAPSIRPARRGAPSPLYPARSWPGDGLMHPRSGRTSDAACAIPWPCAPAPSPLIPGGPGDAGAPNRRSSPGSAPRRGRRLNRRSRATQPGPRPPPRGGPGRVSAGSAASRAA